MNSELMGKITKKVMSTNTQSTIANTHMQYVIDASLNPLLMFVLWGVLVCVCVFVWEDK